MSWLLQVLVGNDEGEILELWGNVELCFGGKSFVRERSWK